MKFRSTLPLLLLAAALPAHSVTIQYSGGSGTGSGTFTGVANLFGCSGVLLADGVHVLTAAHCAGTVSINGSLQTILTPSISSLAFFTGAYPSGFIDNVTGVHFNPLTAEWFPTDLANSLLMYDVAVLDLAVPAPPDATRYNLDLSGFAIANNSPVVLAGWGYGGYPGGDITGTEGTRRGGTNTVAGVFTDTSPFLTGHPVIPLPDLPIELDWTTSSLTGDPTNLLGLANGGDSGGPLIYNGNVIGVAAFGDLPRTGILPIGDTYLNGYTNLADPGNAAWLNSLLDAPEPGSWMLAAGGALLLWLRRRSNVS